ncbi:MAG: hypothetical protein SCALA702_01250 [Melioribacteraceae bacterium]|nr:MAG: hypothetical protein SCALA702_01250 [Melioribacteraceae bacterium]
MKTYLLIYNPKHWTWDDMQHGINLIEKTGNFYYRWSCGVNKSINVDDRLFLIQLGVEPKGIFASGYATSGVFQDVHWNHKKELANYVYITFDVILNPIIDKIISLNELKENVSSEQQWAPPGSGILIRETAALNLENVWFASTHTQQKTKSLTDLDSDLIFEGAKFQAYRWFCERNPILKSQCIEYHGLSCSVCGFNFNAVYGELGANYIHVHHLKPLAKNRGSVLTNAKTDLAPICPNCHSMIHRKKEELTIEELKNLIKLNQKNV